MKDSSISVALLFGIFLVAVLTLLTVTQPEHSCNSPCTVHFKEPMTEDQLYYNYMHGYLKVWKDSPDAN